MARTDLVTLERDGSNGGLQISFAAGFRQVVYCLGVSQLNGASLNKRIFFNPTAAARTQPLYLDSDQIGYVNCSFGGAYDNAHLTTVVLERYADDNRFVGMVTSTYPQ
ncbi:MAG TPA: hypothetical protein VHK65_13920 [Candidatus Dormibacteraeota bacterium]|nr:hypothetical protein [Candidatus Dormibacteraeota bacterium]